MSVAEDLCVALRKGRCGQRWSQACFSLYPSSWLKFLGHFWYVCAFFDDVRMLPMTSVISESMAYFISGVSGYHLLMAVQSGVSDVPRDSSGDMVASWVNTHLAKRPVPTQA